MKIVCTQENLKSGLQTVARIISNSMTLPILNNVLIKTENGQLKLSATNLEVGINSYIRCKIEEEGQVCLPAKTFTELVNNLPNDNITLVSEEVSVAITSGGYSTKVKNFPPDEFPLIPKIEGIEPVRLSSQVFKQGLDEVIFAASTSESQPEISGTYFGQEKDHLVFTATDRYRLAEKKIAGNFEERKPIIIPHRAALEISRILTGRQEEVELLVNDNQMVVFAGDTEIVSRLIDGQYPPYSQIIPQEFNINIRLERGQLVHALKAAGIFSRATGSVTLEYSTAQQQLRISSASHDVGESAIDIPAEVTGEDGKLFLNYRYMLDALNVIGSGTVVIKVVNDSAPVIFQPADDMKYIYLVMPIKS